MSKINLPFRSIIDLRSFESRFRQALLFTLIEGLAKGESFQFIDDRDPQEVEGEMAEAGLNGYAWGRCDGGGQEGVAFYICRNG